MSVAPELFAWPLCIGLQCIKALEQLGGTSIQLDSIQFNWRGGIGAKVRCWSWRYFKGGRVIDLLIAKFFCILVSDERGQKVENPLLDIVQEIPFGWG